MAPLQAAGALVPWQDTPNGPVFRPDLHGTGFFISTGVFLSARHVFEALPPGHKKMVMIILNVAGVHIMPVAKVIEHPTHDIALGVVHATPEQAALMRPMTLAANTLPVGAEVAVLGYPHNRTDHKLDDDGVALSKLGFTPDFYEGRVEEHSFGGTGLVRRGPTYLTDIAPPPWHFDLGGVSGGPMVSCENGDVHGIYSSGSPGSPDGPEGPGVPAYSIFTDIAVALDWEVLTDQQGRSLTIRELALVGKPFELIGDED